MGNLAKNSDTQGSKQTTEIALVSKGVPVGSLKVGDKIHFKIKMTKPATAAYYTVTEHGVKPKNSAHANSKNLQKLIDKPPEKENGV